MSLGETIYRLRSEKKLSQGDLAERLEVSRQSISKWENNSAVPDLAKIVKLSEIFEVSLDALVKGEKAPYKSEGATSISEAATPIPEGNVEGDRKKTGFSVREVAGTILLCMAFLVTLFVFIAGGGFLGVVLAFPFLSCGILCFVLKKNVGLWCAWDVYVLLDIYLAFATGVSRMSVRYMLNWTVGSIVAWILLLGLVALIAVTVVCLGKKPLASGTKGRKQLLIAWLVLLALQAVAMLYANSGGYRYITDHMGMLWRAYALISFVLNWSRIVAFTSALVVTMRYVNGRST